MDSLAQFGESRAVRAWKSVAFIALALGYPVSVAARAKQPTPQNQDHAGDRTQPVRARSVEDSLERIASTIEAERSGPEAEAEEQRAKDNLSAQRHMASWAFGAMLAAAFEVAISAVGIILIWRTLIHTRNAAQATQRMAFDTTASVQTAVEANNAIRDANEIAREDRRPILAYIRIDWEDWEGDENHKLATFVWQNVGKRPLRILELTIGRETVPQHLPPNEPDWSTLLPTFQERQTESPGKIIMPDGLHKSVPVKIAPRHFTGGGVAGDVIPQFVYLLARARYVNAISGEHEREFATRIAVQVLPVGRAERPENLPADTEWNDLVVFRIGIPDAMPVRYHIMDIADPNAVQMT